MIVNSSLQIYEKSCDVYLISFFCVAFQLKVLKQNKFWCIYNYILCYQLLDFYFVVFYSALWILTSLCFDKLMPDVKISSIGFMHSEGQGHDNREI